MSHVEVHVTFDDPELKDTTFKFFGPWNHLLIDHVKQRIFRELTIASGIGSLRLFHNGKATSATKRVVDYDGEKQGPRFFIELRAVLETSTAVFDLLIYSSMLGLVLDFVDDHAMHVLGLRRVNTSLDRELPGALETLDFSAWGEETRKRMRKTDDDEMQAASEANAEDNEFREALKRRDRRSLLGGSFFRRRGLFR